MRTELRKFNNDWYDPGSRLKRVLWAMVSAIFFRHSLAMSSRVKASLLRLFGAEVAIGVVIKPSVNIKYPWKLRIGKYTWIGENVWIDNLAMVDIGPNCCVSQGAMLLCGNHNYKKSSFDLMVGKITLEEGVWVGAQSVVCPKVHCASHAVLSVGSIATSDLEAYQIYQGNPAKVIKERKIEE